MSADDIERIRKLEAAATPGPWVASKQREALRTRANGWIFPGNIVSDATKQIVVTQTGNAANSDFIAAARTTVPALLSAIADRDARIAEIREVGAGLVKSFREVEYDGRRLYDVATHRWVDLLDTALGGNEEKQ